MADTPPKFPWRRPKIESTNDSSNPNKTFFQSASRRLVKEIFTNVKCLCGKSFSGENQLDYPMVAPCGHFKHNSCTNITNDQQTVVKCGTKCRDDLEEVKRVLPTIDLSTDIEVHLKAFYDAINKPGYKCIACPDYHPSSNLIRVLKDDKGQEQEGGIYICVWCAADNKEYDKYTVRFIVDEDEISTRNKETPLNSLDRTVPNMLCILFQCCCCRQTLLTNRAVEKLPCNHYRHRPSGNIYFKHFSVLRRGPSIRDMAMHSICNLCKEPVPDTKSINGVRIYMNDYITDRDINLDLDMAKICKKCEEFHPYGNWSRWRKSEEDEEENLCKWCIVEKKFAESLAEN